MIHELRKNGYWVAVDKKLNLLQKSKNPNKLAGFRKVLSPLRKVEVTKEEIRQALDELSKGLNCRSWS